MNGSKKTIMAIMAILIAVGLLWYTNRSVTPKKATPEDVAAEALNGGYRLMDTQELKELWDKNLEGFLLVDTRQEWEYRSGHIKGAVNFPMEPTWWSRWQKRGAMEKLLGPDKRRLIVFY